MMCLLWDVWIILGVRFEVFQVLDLVGQDISWYDNMRILIIQVKYENVREVR